MSIKEKMDSVSSTRCVGIEITNKCRSRALTDPEFYIDNGEVHTSPDCTIQPGQKGVCIFKKRAYSVYGVAGVLSYHLGNIQISVLFSNPYNYFMYSIEYALYVPDEITPTDYNLYKKMNNELTESASFTKTALGNCNSCLHITKKCIYVSARMSNEKKAILKIDIRDD